MSKIEPILDYALKRGIEIGIRAYKNERESKLNDKRILIVKSDAEKRFGGRMVIKNLEVRGLIAPYQFGIEEVIEEDGNPIKRGQGYIYYKLSDLNEAIENGNLLKGVRRTKTLLSPQKNIDNNEYFAICSHCNNKIEIK